MFLPSSNRSVLFVLSVLAAFIGCSDPDEHPLSRTVTDDRPELTLNPTLPFRIEFGRGSGWHGLDTVVIDESGSVIMHRQTSSGWETTTFTLTRTEVDSVLDSLNDHHILGLNREYHADVEDGTQWVFWAKQDGNTKTIYFNNYFPKSIIAFASDLDARLDVANRSLVWNPVPPDKTRNHEKRLWDSIKSP